MFIAACAKYFCHPAAYTKKHGDLIILTSRAHYSELEFDSAKDDQQYSLENVALPAVTATMRSVAVYNFTVPDLPGFKPVWLLRASLGINFLTGGSYSYVFVLAWLCCFVIVFVFVLFVYCLMAI